MRPIPLILAACALSSPTLLSAQDGPALPAEATPSQRSATTASADPDAIRCVRVQETGSRVRAARVCKTNAQWNRIADAGNRQASDMVEANRVASIQGD